MILLIGGASCTGKTLLAQELMDKLKISYLSIDHIKMGLIRGLDQCDFKANDKDFVIAEKIFPVIQGIIETAIENNQNLIIEGCYILPHLYKELKEKYPEQIKSYYLVFSSSFCKQDFSNIFKYRNIIESRKYAETRTPTVVGEENQAIMDECKKFNEKYFVFENDFLKTFGDIIKQIVKDNKKK